MLLLSPPPPLFSWTNHFSPYPPELGKAVCCWCRCRWCGRKTCNHCCYQGKPHRFVHYHAVHMLLFRSAELLLLMRFFFLIIFFVSYALCFIFSAGYTSSIFIIASRSFRCLCVCMRSVVIYNAQYNALHATTYSTIALLCICRTVAPPASARVCIWKQLDCLQSILLIILAWLLFFGANARRRRGLLFLFFFFSRCIRWLACFLVDWHVDFVFGAWIFKQKTYTKHDVINFIRKSVQFGRWSEGTCRVYVCVLCICACVWQRR